ncbi:MAG: undecaprenyl-diphosphate phosphatase [Deltaproteobacteria bacterium]|jgi:undecaprenyl-diphosphatase|nr:undecaprenyl-diphosphate phosphatase [Deltaproteobacteria bacterium]
MLQTLLIIAALGLIQGLCEFLPVSSSGHLVLAQALFGLKEPEILLDLTLHLGTLLAVAVFYRRSLAALFSELRFLPGALVSPARLVELSRARPNFRLGLLIILGSFPTAAVGFIFQDFLTGLFASASAVGVALLITAAALTTTAFRRRPPRRGLLNMTAADALLIGLIQGLAIAPGLSRSGLTIAAALLLGLERELAARYSFLLSIPAILGGLALSLAQGLSSALGPATLALGFSVAAVAGWWALKLLTGLVDRGRLHFFAPWCLLAGLAALLLPVFS